MEQMKLDRLNVLLVDDSGNMLRLLDEILRGLKVRSVVSVNDVPDAFPAWGGEWSLTTCSRKD